MNARIGLINYAAERPEMGIARYTMALLSGLRQQGVPLTVLHAGNTTRRDDVVPLRWAGRVPGLLTLGQAEIAWSAFRRDLRLVHDPTGTAPLFLTGARRVATIHDAIPFVQPETSTMLDRMVYHYWLPRAAQRLHAIITVSDQSKADLVRFLRVNPEIVTVVPSGVDHRYRRLPEQETRSVLARYGIDFPYLLYVGAVGPRNKRKNLPRLLEAFAALRRWSTRWRLVVVGARHTAYRPVFETIERLGLAPYVHFTGFVAESDLPSIYNGADLFVFPSLYEGFGLPVLEAMACGTPVITSNNSSLPEVAGDAAVLVDPLDGQALAEALRQVLADHDLAAELGRKGLARAQEYTWERTARETVAVYERVLGQKTTQEDRRNATF